MKSKYLFLLFFGWAWVSTSFANQGAPVDFSSSEYTKSEDKTEHGILQLSKATQRLKRDLVTINYSVQGLKNRARFPATNRLSVFLTINSGDFFELDTVSLKINDQLITTHQYTEQERGALKNGATHLFLDAELLEHQSRMTVFFTGVRPDGTKHRRAVSRNVDKNNRYSYLALIIDDSKKNKSLYLK